MSRKKPNSAENLFLHDPQMQQELHNNLNRMQETLNVLLEIKDFKSNVVQGCFLNYFH